MTQRSVVEVILINRNNYYAVLGVTQTATEAEIRKAYKLRAMECHPDKCQHPKAEEAFKLIAMAHETLKDPAKRRVYDHHGAEGVKAHEAGQEPGAAAAFARRRQQGRHYEDHVFVDPVAEMFSAMFGADPRRRPHYQRHPQEQQQHAQQQRHRQQDGEFPPGFALMLPLLMFFLLVTFLQMGFATAPDNSARRGNANGRPNLGGLRPSTLYSLVRNPREGFSYERHTDIAGVDPVPYFVQLGFADTLRRHSVSERSIDLQVAREYRDSLGRRCQTELKRRQENGVKASKAPSTCTEYDRMRDLPSV